jgi:hypothetical protein
MGRIIGKVYFPPRELVEAPPLKKEEPEPAPLYTEPKSEAIEPEKKVSYSRKPRRKIENIYEDEE